MNILVIGGSYFFGRVFVMLASKEHSVIVVNRGTYSMGEFGVRQMKGDRHDGTLWQQCADHYDAIVDFCAYQPGDITCVLENLAGSVSQYILISTVDVYERGTGLVKDEDTPFETRLFPGEGGAYIAGKVALEHELAKLCGERGVHRTVLRPAILYGPYNYAPRESVFIRMAVQDRMLPELLDAGGRFQLVYVKDAAEAVVKCLGNKVAFDRAYNLCQDGSIGYNEFFTQLCQAAGGDIDLVPMSAAEAGERGIPLPFPVYENETELSSNERGKRELGIGYLPLPEGMARTYRAFADIFEK